MSHNPSYPPPPPPPPPPGGAQFALHHIVDPQYQGMLVATFEHPHDWPARSQVVWNFQDVQLPVQVYASTFSPDGMEAVEFLPTEACFWLTPDLMPVPGQRSMGSTCLPPMGAIDALTRFAIPKYRGNRQNLRLLYTQPVPNLAQIRGADWLRNLPHEGVMARIDYAVNGRFFEEEFYACVMWHPPNGQQTNWGLSPLFSLRAERGQLDAARQRLWRISISVKNNPAWGQLYQQVTQQLSSQHRAHIGGVMTRLRGEAEYGRQLREFNAWQSDISQQRLNNWWASDERLQQQRGDVLSGTTRYEDPGSPSGIQHQDRGYHQYVWTNGQGPAPENWIHSNQANYDPNQDPSVNRSGYWFLARKV